MPHAGSCCLPLTLHPLLTVPPPPPPQATALATIGKFVIKKKVGEKEAIFGSVTTSELVEAIRMQTGRELDKKAVTLPEIKTLGTFDASGAPAWLLTWPLTPACRGGGRCAAGSGGGSGAAVAC